ncbi:MAG: segregation/condensation protein A [Anaerolineaceae bacterium]|jgi:segregation and condensation protein A
MRVALQIAGHSIERYRVDTTVYAGPLDLLLELIERAELDITTLAIAQVTDQFLAYLRALQDRDAAEVSAFLVMAARLVQMKSAVLLPRPTLVPHSSDQEDDPDALARQLIQYRRFKQIAGWLAARETANLRTYLRLAQPPVKIEARLDLSDVTLADLVSAARRVFSSQPDLAALSQVVTFPRITIRQKISTILTTLRRSARCKFQAVLANRSRAEIVVTFLALLELIKRRVVEARQNSLFAEIEFDQIGDYNDQLDADLDFDE